jgi:hypothetical protein
VPALYGAADSIMHTGSLALSIRAAPHMHIGLFIGAASASLIRRDFASYIAHDICFASLEPVSRSGMRAVEQGRYRALGQSHEAVMVRPPSQLYVTSFLCPRESRGGSGKSRGHSVLLPHGSASVKYHLIALCLVLFAKHRVTLDHPRQYARGGRRRGNPRVVYLDDIIVHGSSHWQRTDEARGSFLQPRRTTAA